MLSVLSTEQEPGPLDLPAGRRVVARLRVDGLRLAPGRYRLDLAARATLASLDHLPNVAAVEIAPALFDPHTRPGYHRSLIHLSPRWEIDSRPVEAPAPGALALPAGAASVTIPASIRRVA